MKRAFTLVELLIVVVVLVILMSIVFSLSGIGQASEARNVTMSRMQKIENCISGYYAAFGSYPPVKLHGTRNIYYKTNKYGIQQTENEDPDPSKLDWARVNAACRSQPVGMYFPFKSNYDEYIKLTSQELMELHNAGGEDNEYANNPALANNIGNFDPGYVTGDARASGSWQQCQVFKFGLMSYLLPRFIVMMGNEKNQIYNDFKQWWDNNQKPCRMEDGAPYNSWDELNDDVMNEGTRWKVECLPSQAVTARWMPNLAGILHCERDLTLYGVTVSGGEECRNFTIHNPNPIVYSGGNSQGGEGSGDGSTQYVLDGVTCRDGWNNEFYYYCPPPYQSYKFWSAGPNGKTFPPWISEEEISNDGTLSKNRNLIQNWRADDLMHMSY